MANRSYLVCCDSPEACPSEQWPHFDLAQHVLAEDVYSVPLLWLASFRRSDVRVSLIADKRGQQYTDISPITTVEAAGQQLTDAVPTLNHLFGNHGSFDDWVSVFRGVLDNPPGKYVSISWIEIAYMVDLAESARQLKRALEVLSAPIELIRRLPPAPLVEPAKLPEIPVGLRGKAAVAFLMEITKQQKKVVEGILQNCHGDVRKALEFFDWQTRETTYGRNEPPGQEPAWQLLAGLTNLRFSRQFPTANDALGGHLTHPDDQWNATRLVGVSYQRPVPWDR